MRKAAERDGVRVVMIRGMTGVGKSVLAARAAAEVESRFPEGHIYLDLRKAEPGPRPATRALTDIIQAFRPTYAGTDDATAVWADFRTLLNGRRVLILAENVHAAEEVEWLIPPTPGSLLIVTTQSRFDLPGAVPLELDVLSEDDGATLVGVIAPRTKDAAAELAWICGYLPLAIRIACGTLTRSPDVSPDEYIRRLGGVSERAKLVRAALDVSFVHLPSETKRFLAATTVFPADFEADGLTAVWGQPEDQTDALLGTVISRHLIQWDDKRRRFSLHDLVRAYITETADAADLGLFATRHAQYYADLCSHIERLYREGGESVFSATPLRH